MSINSFMTVILKDAVEHLIGTKKAADRKEAVGMIHPTPADGGFMKVHVVVLCPCGEPCHVFASPVQRSRAETDRMMDIIPEKEKPRVVEAHGKDYDPEKHGDDPSSVTNLGMTDKVCDECGNKFIVCWEFQSIGISKDCPLPWDEPESPDRNPVGELTGATTTSH